MLTIYRKELADHFGSIRFLILFCLITMLALVTTYMAATNIRQALEGMSKPSHVFLLLFTAPGQFFSLVEFIAFFGPLIGIITGFDAINRERTNRTLAKLVSQPIFRDAVINGKADLAYELAVEVMPDFEPVDVRELKITRPVYEPTKAEGDEAGDGGLARGATAARSRPCSSISIISRRSMTRWGMPSATACCGRWRDAWSSPTRSTSRSRGR